MATKQFLLPDLGEGLTEGEIVSWLVAVGDTVDVDQEVAEVETAKAVVAVPSPFAGTVVTLHGEPGEEIQVGQPLLTIDVGGDGDGAAGTPPAEAQVSDVVPEPAPAPAAEKDEDGESGSVLVGYGTGGRGGGRRRRVTGRQQTATRPGEPPRKVQRDGRPLAKPPVRKLAKDLGVDLEYVPGTGPEGIITRADVEAFVERGAPAAEPAAGRGVLVTDDEGRRLPSAPPNELEPDRIRLSQLRKAVSAQMTRSRREIPEAVTWVEADATPLWEYRTELNASQDRVKVSALAIIMRMCVAGLREFPAVNASLDAEAGEIVQHNHCNLGFAAQTDRGLVVPVINGAHRMSTLQIAAQLRELAATARAGKLAPEQMTGGTFTLSNYGAFGVDGGDMVINHPEAAILGVGRIADKPWVLDGAVVPRKVITLALAFDHRVMDGGDGAGFLRYVADLIENPTLLAASL